MSPRALRIFTRHLPFVSLALSLMIFAAVLCFLFPEILTTPEIRSRYPISLFRKIMYWGFWVAVFTSLYGLLFLQHKKISGLAIALLSVSLLLGGSDVSQKENFENFAFHFGLDWFLVDLFFLGVIFIPVEVFFPQHKQQTLDRPELKVDLTYFAVGHIGFQFILLITQKPADLWLEFLRIKGAHSFLSELPILAQLLLALLIADFSQYWIHRAFHRNRSLWEFHKIHHSIKSLDWLAGSRLHIVDIVVTRSLVYLMVMYCGFSEQAILYYLLAMSLQTVLIHSNCGIGFGFLKYIIVTPAYHHWHHNDRPETYDKNFAVHFPFIDYLFGTYYLPKDKWPTEYGVKEDYPSNYWGQFIEPFKRIFW